MFGINTKAIKEAFEQYKKETAQISGYRSESIDFEGLKKEVEAMDRLLVTLLDSI